MVSQLRTPDTTTPIVLMGYLNPPESAGYERFAQLAGEAGVGGVLMVGMEAAGNFLRWPSEHGLDMISLITSATSDDRLARISSVATGFLYYVSLKGKTRPARWTLTRWWSVSGCRGAVGFGIRDAASAALQTVWLWAACWWPSWPDITATGRRSLNVGRYDSPDACDH